MSVEIKNLSHTYSAGSPFEFKALKDITITIEDGSFIGIIGHTGSGKSTLIQHLNGLLTPTSGTVLIDGKDIFETKKTDLIALRHHIGLVFQYPEHQEAEPVEGDAHRWCACARGDRAARFLRPAAVPQDDHHDGDGLLP